MHGIKTLKRARTHTWLPSLYDPLLGSSFGALWAWLQAAIPPHLLTLLRCVQGKLQLAWPGSAGGAGSSGDGDKGDVVPTCLTLAPTDADPTLYIGADDGCVYVGCVRSMGACVCVCVFVCVCVWCVCVCVVCACTAQD